MSFVFGTMGNFSLIQGKAKSRKVVFLECIDGRRYIATRRLWPYSWTRCTTRSTFTLTPNKDDWHASKAKNRIQAMAGLDPRVNHPNFKHYRFRGLLTNKERLKLTDYVMQSFDNIGFVVIDGVVDLASKGRQRRRRSDRIRVQVVAVDHRIKELPHFVCIARKQERPQREGTFGFLSRPESQKTTTSLAKSEINTGVRPTSFPNTHGTKNSHRWK